VSVIQISRIQQRRGKKNSQTGFPQLASGELGWAIDTQQLYIGNGAVSEGAPAVGNTELLTEHTDIMELMDLYQYRRNDTHIQTGVSTTAPFQRSLQERLDDIVSVRAFGVFGDGTTDVTVALQQAINELFLFNINPSDRVILYMEPGVYIIHDEIRIPPHAHIVGAGIDSTIIKQTSRNTAGCGVFRMIDAISFTNQYPTGYLPFTSMNSTTTLNSESTWPRKIFISGITLKTTFANTILYLDNTELTSFDRVKFEGIYTNGSTYNDSQVGVNIRGTSSAFSTNSVIFRNCDFYKTGIGAYSDAYGDHLNVQFDNCRFQILSSGIDVGGGVSGSIGTKVSRCYFDQIDRYGFRVKKGYGNSSSSNTYMNVGNLSNSDTSAIYPVVLFVTENNTSTDDFFNRNKVLKNAASNSVYPFIPTVQTSSMIHDNTGYQVVIEALAAVLPQSLLRFPFFKSAVYIIDYVISKNSQGGNGYAVRTGSMTVTTDMSSKTGHINDNYNYIGDASVENISFFVEIQNNLDDSTHDTLAIKYLNPTGNGFGTMNYSYRMLTM